MCVYGELLIIGTPVAGVLQSYAEMDALLHYPKTLGFAAIIVFCNEFAPKAKARDD
jgi:hypothetical protein